MDIRRNAMATRWLYGPCGTYLKKVLYSLWGVPQVPGL